MYAFFRDHQVEEFYEGPNFSYLQSLLIPGLGHYGMNTSPQASSLQKVLTTDPIGHSKNTSRPAFAVYHTGTRTILADIDLTRLQLITISRYLTLFTNRPPTARIPLSSTRNVRNTIQHPPLSQPLPQQQSHLRPACNPRPRPGIF